MRWHEAECSDPSAHSAQENTHSRQQPNSPVRSGFCLGCGTSPLCASAAQDRRPQIAAGWASLRSRDRLDNHPPPIQEFHITRLKDDSHCEGRTKEETCALPLADGCDVVTLRPQSDRLRSVPACDGIFVADSSKALPVRWLRNAAYPWWVCNKQDVHAQMPHAYSQPFRTSR